VAPQLTKRERAVLTAIACGLTQPAAAHRLGISDGTFRRTREAAVARLRATTTTQAVALALAFDQIDRVDVCERRIPAWPTDEPDVGRNAQVAALMTKFEKGRTKRAMEALRRRNRFRQLRAEGVSVEDAAVQLGVARHTGFKYERRRLEAIARDQGARGTAGGKKRAG
jgi:DNA-binding CsgD family transcriptional regulator